MGFLNNLPVFSITLINSCATSNSIMGDKMDTFLNGLILLLVSVVVLCSAVIPVVSSQINGLSSLISDSNVLDIGGYQTLLGVAILMTILGLVIGIIKLFTAKSDR